MVEENFSILDGALVGFYYLLQSVQAAWPAARRFKRRWLVTGYLVLAGVMLAVVLFAEPVVA
ncbi:hypothetical protein ADIMK_0081 [Marinobacterium lacunae]|uniref:Uncharacterized protein n=1 Tax=Marinobacterium lacunae TaxID=1232683 RepID=A0A081G4R4_9GAMM|nr:hypothetical protein [Marinobacterium lacunae]KEA65769.1 hypothetical protein ADIMK_0081 [Marinobacterium lacunae]